MNGMNFKPFISKVLDSLSDANLASLASLIDSHSSSFTNRSLINPNNLLTASDKGIGLFTIQLDEKSFKTGYLLYNDTYCVLLGYVSNSEVIVEYNIDVATKTFVVVKEHLTTDYLRLLVAIKAQTGELDLGDLPRIPKDIDALSEDEFNQLKGKAWVDSLLADGGGVIYPVNKASFYTIEGQSLKVVTYSGHGSGFTGTEHTYPLYNIVDIKANQSLSGGESLLTSLKINNTNYKVQNVESASSGIVATNSFLGLDSEGHVVKGSAGTRLYRHTLDNGLDGIGIISTSPTPITVSASSSINLYDNKGTLSITYYSENDSCIFSFYALDFGSTASGITATGYKFNDSTPVIFSEDFTDVEDVVSLL